MGTAALRGEVASIARSWEDRIVVAVAGMVLGWGNLGSSLARQMVRREVSWVGFRPGVEMSGRKNYAAESDRREVHAGVPGIVRCQDLEWMYYWQDSFLSRRS